MVRGRARTRRGDAMNACSFVFVRGRRGGARGDAWGGGAGRSRAGRETLEDARATVGRCARGDGMDGVDGAVRV